MGGISRSEALRLTKICLPQIDASLDVSSLGEGDVSTKSLCRLWAGMGTILAVRAEAGSSTHEFIVKHVVPPRRKSRSFGDRRKADSYLVEANFYEKLAPRLIEEHGLALPVPYHVERDGDNDEVIICMSRLDGSPAYLDTTESINSVLDWLSTLHAATWGSAEEVDLLVSEVGLQPVGSYWHLDTRPDEHSNMSRRGWEGRLRLAARAIDERLKRDGMQCVVHGDAKDANVLLGRDGSRIAARMYDLQYCGRGCPAVDLAYFLCVAVGDVDGGYIEYYHRRLVEKLRVRGRRDVPALNELEDSIDLALCDFQRFMCGWGQWGSDISANVLRVLQRLDGGKPLASEEAYCDAMRREYG